MTEIRIQKIQKIYEKVINSMSNLRKLRERENKRGRGRGRERERKRRRKITREIDMRKNIRFMDRKNQ